MRAGLTSMKIRTSLIFFAVLTAVIALPAGYQPVYGQKRVKHRKPAPYSVAPADTALVSSKLAPEVLAKLAGGGTASVLVFMSDQADLSSAYGIADRDARGWYVYNTLREFASRSQASLKQMLDAEGRTYQSFWAANMLVVDADQQLVSRLAGRADVQRIDANQAVRWIEDPVVADKQDASLPSLTQAAEWGVSNVNAPQVWGMGSTGQGIVVGVLDTGTRWTHAALKGHYRGWNGATANHNYNWHDAVHTGGGVCGPNTVEPCDDNGHGTHTAGSIVGDDGAGNQIGVAPGAKWIGCRNMDQGNGTPATYTECFQFMIAPTDLNGNNADASLRPHVINNSWGCPTSEGCSTRAELETIVNNTQAAGIFVAVSAGNSGPGCSSITDPPAIYASSFTVGAYDISNTLAGFSSRGPSTFYTPNLLKPEISAPGVNVRSSYRTSDTTYASLSGTSMASPHVAGVVALLWAARPSVSRNIAATKNALQNTANPTVILSPVQTCGGTPSSAIPNNSFGYGRVDALAALNSIPGPTAAMVTVSGRVLGRDGMGIRGSVVTAVGPDGTVHTARANLFGYYAFSDIAAGSAYLLRASAKGHVFAPKALTISDTLTDANFIEGQ